MVLGLVGMVLLGTAHANGGSSTTQGIVLTFVAFGVSMWAFWVFVQWFRIALRADTRGRADAAPPRADKARSRD